MSRADEFVDLWNAGRVEEALGETSTAYSYTDSVVGGPHDRDAHVALMKQIYETMPDRRIEIHRSWTADGAEFIEYTWRGTTASGETIEHEFFGILEFDTAGRTTRQRHLAL